MIENQGHIFWYLLSGLILGTLGLTHHRLKKTFLTPAFIYLVLGVVLGPSVLSFIQFEKSIPWPSIELVTEFVVMSSVFAAGLKMRPRWRDPLWHTPLRLAFVGVVSAIVLVTLAGMSLGFSLALALLFASVISPTDPVLASAIQVEDAMDKDHLRFSLTAEAGLNDGSAFPFVLLALGLCGLHEIGSNGMTWLLKDVLYGIGGGAILGALIAVGATKALNLLKQNDAEDPIILDEFFGLGLLALVYGLSLLAGVLGFVAAFVAGVVFRRNEEIDPELQSNLANIKAVTAKPATNGIISFNDNIEKVGEFFCILILGSALKVEYFTFQNLLLAAIILFVARPLSVLFSFSTLNPTQKKIACWFGVRGVGSLFYLAYAMNRDPSHLFAPALMGPVVVTITMSILLHGFTANFAMNAYKRLQSRRART